MSVAGPLRLIHFSPHLLPSTEEEASALSPEMETIPELYKERVEGEAVVKSEKIFGSDFGFSLKEFINAVCQDIVKCGGKVAGFYSKGGIIDHVYFGKDLSTADLDLCIKLDEEAGAFFYQKRTWKKLEEKILSLLKEREIEVGHLKNLYLHFNPKEKEYFFLVSIPVKGQLKGIDLQIVLRQNISCLSSCDSIQIDWMPFLKMENGHKPAALMAKSIQPYLFSRSVNLKRAGYFETHPSARVVRKGFFDLSRRASQGLMTCSDKAIEEYWLGFQDQYFQEGEGIFGAFEDDLWRFLKDHLGYDFDPRQQPKRDDERSLRSLFYLLNMDLFIRHLCNDEAAREALRLIISKYTHRACGLSEPTENRDLIASLDEIERHCLRVLPRKDANFMAKQSHSSPFFFELTLPSRNKCFLFNLHPLDKEGSGDPSTLLARSVVSLFSSALTQPIVQTRGVFPPPDYSPQQQNCLVEEKESLWRSKQKAKDATTSAAVALVNAASPQGPAPALPELVAHSAVAALVDDSPPGPALVTAPRESVPPSAVAALVDDSPSGPALVTAPPELAPSSAVVALVNASPPGPAPVKAPPKSVPPSAVAALVDATGPIQPQPEIGPAPPAPRAADAALVKVPPYPNLNVKLGRMKSFRDFFSLFTPNEIAALKGKDMDRLGSRLSTLYVEKYKDLESMNEDEKKSLKDLQIAFIRILLKPNRSLDNKTLAGDLICTLASKLKEKSAFDLASEFIRDLKGKDKAQEIEVSLRFYNKLFGCAFEPVSALDMSINLSMKMAELPIENRIENLHQLFRPFENFPLLLGFFFQEYNKISQLPLPLFFDFLKVVLKKAEKVESEGNEAILLSALARYEKEKEEGHHPLLDFEPVLGIERAKIKEKYEQLFGKKKANVPSKKSAKKKKSEGEIASVGIGQAGEKLLKSFTAELETLFKANPLEVDFETTTLGLNREMMSFIQPYIKKSQWEVAEAILTSFRKWNEAQCEKIREKKEQSLVEKRVLSNLILNRPLFLNSIIPLFPLERRVAIFSEFFTELQDHLLKSEMTLNCAVKAWRLYVDAFKYSPDLKQLQLQFNTYEGSLQAIYSEDSYLLEALVNIEEGMIYLLSDRSSKKMDCKEEVLFLNAILIPFLERAKNLNPIFLKSSFNTIFAFLDNLSNKDIGTHKEIFRTLSLLFSDQSIASQMHDWFSQINRVTRAYIYRVSFEIYKRGAGISREERELLLKKIEESFKSLLEEKESPDRDPLSQAMIFGDIKTMLRIGNEFLQQKKYFESLQIAQRLLANYNRINDDAVWLLKARSLNGLGMTLFTLYSYEETYFQSGQRNNNGSLNELVLGHGIVCAYNSYCVNDVAAGDLYLPYILRLKEKINKKEVPKFFSWLFLKRGLALIKMGLWKEADENYRKAFTMDPVDTELLCGLAETSLHFGKKEEAIRCYSLAIMLNPKGIKYYLDLCQIYEKAKQYDLAIQILEKLKTNNQGLLYTQYFRVDLKILNYYLRKNEMILAFKQMRILFENNMTVAEDFWEKELKGKFCLNKLEKEFLERIKKNDRDGEALLLLQFLYFLEKKYKLALKVSKKIDQLADVVSQPFHLLILGTIYKNLRDWEKAIICYKKLSFISSDLSVLQTLANLCWSAKEFAKAYEGFQEIEHAPLELNSRDCERFGALLFIHKEWEKALAFFEKSTGAINPSYAQEDRLSSATLSIMKSLAFLKMNRCEEAVAILFESIEDEEEVTDNLLEAALYAALKTNQVERFRALLLNKLEKNPALCSVIDPILCLVEMCQIPLNGHGREAEFLEDFEKNLDNLIQRISDDFVSDQPSEKPLVTHLEQIGADVQGYNFYDFTGRIPSETVF